MIIQSVVSGYLNSNMHILRENGHCIIIDPCENIPDDIGIPDMIILTHEHIDHISGIDFWKDSFDDLPVVCSLKCAEGIADTGKNMSEYFDILIGMQEVIPDYCPPLVEPVAFKADKVFSEKMTIEWQGHKMFLKETPGHSEGSICILVDDIILFSGDSLLKDFKTITKLPGGSRRKYREKTLPFLESLGKETIVYSGHYSSFKLNTKI